MRRRNQSPSPSSRRTTKYPRGYVGAAEAEKILGASRTPVLEAANSGRLPGRLIDKPGKGRYWIFRKTAVLQAAVDRSVIRQRQRVHRLRRERVVWLRHFGEIPNGFTVALRDGKVANLDPLNLCLIPLKSKFRHIAGAGGVRKKSPWSAKALARLREMFPGTPTEEIARELGRSVSAVRRQARDLKLRKTRDCIAEQASLANRLPLGTERIKEHTDLIWIKVSFDGDYYHQWRPKHHLIWEREHERSVPRGFCIDFKDGNKRNFDPDNLELVTRNEIAAVGFARYLSYPEPLQKAIKLTKRLAREVEHQRNGASTAKRVKLTAGPRAPQRRWTKQMDEILRRKYPRLRIVEVSAALGVSDTSLRQRARRLKIRRLPEVIVAQARAAAAPEKARVLAKET